MRFHAKFPWVQALGGIVWIVICTLRLHNHSTGHSLSVAYLILGAVWTLSAILLIASHFLVHWDLTESGLRERRFWTTREVTYQDISAVAPWPIGNASTRSDILQIEFGMLGSSLNPRASILANPRERSAFLGALRKQAKQAEFTA